MKKLAVLGVVALLLLVGSQSELVAQTRCGIVFGGFLTLNPENVTVEPGETIGIEFTAKAIRGDFYIRASVLTDARGFDRQGPLDWDVVQGQTITVSFKVKVLDEVAPGEYNLRVVASGRGSNCEGPPNTFLRTYRFDATVGQFDAAFTLADPSDDLFRRSTGAPFDASGLSGVDIVEVSGRRTSDAVILVIGFDSQLPDDVANAPQRVGCYLDTNGDASVAAPFNPSRFEFLVINSWLSSENNFIMISLADPDTTLAGAVRDLDQNRLSMYIDLRTMGSPSAVGWVCFSELLAEGGEVADLAPNDGVGAAF